MEAERPDSQAARAPLLSLDHPQCYTVYEGSFKGNVCDNCMCFDCDVDNLYGCLTPSSPSRLPENMRTSQRFTRLPSATLSYRDTPSHVVARGSIHPTSLRHDPGPQLITCSKSLDVVARVASIILPERVNLPLPWPSSTQLRHRKSGRFDLPIMIKVPVDLVRTSQRSDM